MTHSLLVARVSILPFAVLTWAIIGWYAKTWDAERARALPRYSPQRLVPFVVGISPFVIALGQMSLYRELTSPGPITDPFVGVILVGECVVALALGFAIVFQRRRRE